MSFANTYTSVRKEVVEAFKGRINAIVQDGRTVPVYYRAGDKKDFPLIMIGEGSQELTYGKNQYYTEFTQRLFVYDAAAAGGYPDRSEAIADKVVGQLCTRTGDYPALSDADLEIVSIQHPTISSGKEYWEKQALFVFVSAIAIKVTVQQKLTL